MKRNKYINSFNTTAEYDNYIESAAPGFPNVGLTKDDGKLHYRSESPNDYQIWGTTTATENFNIILNNTNVEVTVDPLLGEFYLTGWTGTLTSLNNCFESITHITSIKKFAIDTSNVTNIGRMFYNCSSLKSVNLSGMNTSSVTNIQSCFYAFYGQGYLEILDLSNWDLTNVTNNSMIFLNQTNITDVYIDVEATLMKLTNNLSSSRNEYIPASATIHYNDVDYKWQNDTWTPQSV